MSEISGTVKNVSSAISKLKAYNERIQRAKVQGVKTVAVETRDIVISKYVGGGHPDHPNIITGGLKKSIHYRMTDEVSPRVTAVVGSSVKYAPWVEFGHDVKRGGNTIGIAKPYPFLRPAFNDMFNTGRARQIFTDIVKGVMK